MSKHTPGPWKYDTTKLADWYTRITHCVSISGESEIRLYGNEAEANARLISAAPELLEALEALVDMPDERSIYDISDKEIDLWVKAKKVIAKAKGETP